MPELTQESAYERAIRCLYERINYEKTGHATYSDANYRLDRMRRLLNALDDPHLAAPVIHIAGTKGKGSTATLMSRMLKASGYRTALYTSPHLVRLEERFQIDNQPCSPLQLVTLVEQTQVAANQVENEGGGRATFFELTTALAFLYFAQQHVEAIVLEVGLGGRLDSTNVCQPCATVITTIGLDHQAQLGNTIGAIALEKAGIIKPGVPVISSARHPDARQAITQRALELSAPLRIIDRDFTCHWTPFPYQASGTQSPGLGTHPQNQLAAAQVDYCPMYTPSLVGRSTWQLSLLGAHHADNLAAGLAVIDSLAEQGWRIPRDALPLAVLNTTVAARLQIVGQNPVQLIDTAHNPDSIQATLAAVHSHFPGRKRTIILASSRDKDIDAILELLMTGCEHLILTQYQNNQRGLPLEELAAHAQRCRDRLASGPKIVCASSPSEAWKHALNTTAPTDLICATGSFFLAADLMGQ